MGETEIPCSGAGAAPLAPQASPGRMTTAIEVRMKGREEEILGYSGGGVQHGQVVQLARAGLRAVAL